MTDFSALLLYFLSFLCSGLDKFKKLWYCDSNYWSHVPERTALPSVPNVFCSLVVALVNFSCCGIPNMTAGSGRFCWVSQYFNQHLEILFKISLAAENICSCRRLALRFKIIRSIVIWPNVCGRLGTKKTWQLELFSMLTPHQLWTTKLRRARVLKGHGYKFSAQHSFTNSAC